MLCVERKMVVLKTTSWLTTIPSTRSAAVLTRVSRDGQKETTAKSIPSPNSTRHATRSRRIVRHGTSALAPPLVRVSVPRWSLKTSAQERLAAVLTRNCYGRALKGWCPTNHPLHPVIRHWRPVDPLFPPHLPMYVRRARLLRQPLRTLQLTPLPIPPRSPLLIPSQVSPRTPQLIYPQSHPRTHPRGNPPQGPSPYCPTGTMLCVERKMVVLKTTSWLTTMPSTRSAAVLTRVSRDGQKETTAKSIPSPNSTRHATRSRRIVRHGTSALAPPLVRVSVPRWSLKTSAQGRLAAVLTRNWYGRALKGWCPTNHPLHP